MTRRTAMSVLGILAVSCRSWRGSHSASGRFRAFSLREAQRRLEANTHGADVASLDGLTRVVGLVHDAPTRDLIVVGHARPSGDPLALDDLVAAMRARIDRHEWPLVSIDKTPDTRTSGQQIVRLEGVSPRSGFAKKLLLADLFLKNAALQQPPADHLPMPSFFTMCADAARKGVWTGQVSSRLWFHALDASLLVRDDVVAIRELKVGVRTEVTSGLDGARDQTSDAYAAAFTNNLESIAARYQDVRALNGLFDFVAIARGLESFKNVDLDYWISAYPLSVSEIPDRIPLLRRSASIETGGRVRALEVDGGIDMRMLRLRLTEGDHAAFRDAALRSRPAAAALSWPVPLSGWRFFRPEGDEPRVSDEPGVGSYLERRLTEPSPGVGRLSDPRGGVTTAVTINPRDFVRKP